MLYVSSVSGQLCKQFACKSFTKSTTEDTCVAVNAAQTTYPVRSCGKGKYCDATSWVSITQAIKNGTCLTNPAPAPAVTNQTVPGDQCSAKTECFGDATEVSCTKGVCTTTHAAGAYCQVDAAKPTITGHEWCQPGQYCDVAAKVCKAQVATGAVCANWFECSTGNACIKVLPATTFTCQTFYSVANSAKTPLNTVDISKLKPSGSVVEKLVFNANSLCASGTLYNVAPNAITCRPSGFNNDAKNLTSLKRTKGIENTCAYTDYTDATDPTLAITTLMATSKCGFNKDNAAYCDKRRGDQWFKKVLSTMSGKALNTIKCNPVTNMQNCTSAINVITKKDLLSWSQEVQALDNAFGWANYANNDGCVGSSITKIYWQDSSPGFAYSSFTMTSFAAMILAISALLYMF